MLNQYSCPSCSCSPCSCPPAINTCTGCLKQEDATCVFYRGTTLPCTGMVTGTTLDVILKALDSKICSIVPPSGSTNVVVNAVSGQTTVSSSVIGNTTYYTVGVSPAITNNINNLLGQVSNINNYLTGVTTTITSSTLTITHPNSQTWNIEDNITNTNYNGITYSGTSANGVYTDVDVFNTGNIMLNNIQNFVTKSSIAVGDKIIYKIIGQYTVEGSGLSAAAPTFKVSIQNGSSTLAFVSGHPSANIGDKNSIYITLEFNIIDITAGASKAIINGTWIEGLVEPLGLFPQGISLEAQTKSFIGKKVLGIDLTALGIKIEQLGGIAPSQANYNLLRLFTSEVIKKY